MPVEDGEMPGVLLNGCEVQLSVVLEDLQRVLVEIVLLHQHDAPLLLVLFIGFTIKQITVKKIYCFIYLFFYNKCSIAREYL